MRISDLGRSNPPIDCPFNFVKLEFLRLAIFGYEDVPLLCVNFDFDIPQQRLNDCITDTPQQFFKQVPCFV